MKRNKNNFNPNPEIPDIVRAYYEKLYFVKQENSEELRRNGHIPRSISSPKIG